MDISDFLPAIVVGIVVGVSMAQFNRRQKARDRLIDERAASRKQESLLSIDLAAATAELALACAMAIKRGHPNGEIEVGVEAYNKAKKTYYKFLNTQAAEHMQE